MSRMSKIVAATSMAVLMVGTTLASTESASAFGRRAFHGHRGLGVGAAVGLGVGAAALGAVAASAASRNNSYNGYPVYANGPHAGYGYDYYPDHGGYYGPY